MNPVYFILSLALIIAQFTLPVRFAFVPLVVAAATLPDVIIVEVGVGFTLAKILILTGLLRAGRMGLLSWSSRNPLDLLFAAWAIWGILSGFAHNPKDHNPITVRASMVYDFFGTYLYARSYLTNLEAIVRLARVLTACMLLLALMMVYEQAKRVNIPWTLTSGSIARAEERLGRVRAGGPFRHSILAGTVGATCGVILTFFARRNRRRALLVGASCGLVVFCSASSGPIVTLASGLGALFLWFYRPYIRFLRLMAIVTLIGLHFTMKAPVWYLIARVDLAGGSTGWHRAELITGALNHLDRWWLAGTDYTRDWVPFGAGWNDEMTDITNMYLQMGVKGGLPLMLLFIAIFYKSFQLLGRRMVEMRLDGDESEFILWCFGSALFAHCISFLSVAYFDQSVIFLSLTIGVITGLCAVSESVSSETLPAQTQFA